MNGRLAPKPGHKVVCTQPWCPLKAHGFKAEDLADLLIRYLAGESREVMVPEAKRIAVRHVCRFCALNVMQGKNTYLTEPEWQRLDELGQWHHRRYRRKEIWGYRQH